MSDYKKDSMGEEASAFGQRVKGDVKEAGGAVTGNRSLENEGAMEGSMGKARQGQNRMLTGLFRDKESAEKAYSSMSSRGYTKDDVNVMMSDETRNKHYPAGSAATSDLGDKAMEGAGVGSAIGGTVGAVLAGIAAIGTTVALPGLGLLIAGPLAAALAGAGAGGLTGGLVGALVGSGIPEDRAKAYESGIKQGGIMMGVTPRSDDDATYLENEFKTHRGEHIYR